LAPPIGWSERRRHAFAYSQCECVPAGTGIYQEGPMQNSTPFGYCSAVAAGASLGATTVDANLVNPWGIAFSSGGTMWVSDNGTSLSTLYDGTGAKLQLVVGIPKAGGAPGGKTTGQVFNSTTDFLINGGNKALFIFAGEDGTISAWNQAAGANAVIVADRSANGAGDKGPARASNR